MMKKAGLSIRGIIGLSVVALVGVAVNCGGDDGGSRNDGTGGTTTGGSTAPLGGAVTTGGTTGATGGTPGHSCNPGFSPTSGLLSEFAGVSWNPTKGKWGTEGNLTGSVFSYKDTNSTMVHKVETEAYTLSGTVVPALTGGGYAGGGMSFDRCVNTTEYSGIQFTLDGTAAGCDLMFQVQTYSQQSTSSKGGCSESCYGFPKKKVVVGTLPITVTFAELANTGKPATAAALAAEIVGLQWQFQIPSGGDAGVQQPCTDIKLTIDNVQFVK